MKKREYRSYGLIDTGIKNITKTESKLKKAGLTHGSYRINYFSNSAELIVSKDVLEKVKTVLG